jgi:hypothetical protein
MFLFVSRVITVRVIHEAQRLKNQDHIFVFEFQEAYVRLGTALRFELISPSSGCRFARSDRVS